MSLLLSGACSGKQTNVSLPFQQLKACSDGAQNCGPSEGNERDRDDEQGTDPARGDRDCPLEVDDSEPGNGKVDNIEPQKTTELTEKDGLPHVEAVKKLVQLLQLDTEGKIDLASRARVADVIAATENPDCLGRFVLLGGLTVLNEWLQEIHRGKPGDKGNPVETDKPIQELILALLRALAKLPIDLNALQSCSIGKSVNLLRSHKDQKIQRTAKYLVESWKKCVDAEMKSNPVTNLTNYPDITQAQWYIDIWKLCVGDDMQLTGATNLANTPHANKQQKLPRRRKNNKKNLNRGMTVEVKVFTLEEVAKHNSKNDCWVLIAGKVYNVTKFLKDHPGGDDVFLSSTVKDATDKFEDAGHTSTARAMMDDYYIGQIDASTIPDKGKSIPPTQSNYKAYKLGEHDDGQSSLSPSEKKEKGKSSVSSKSIRNLLSSSAMADQLSELEALQSVLMDVNAEPAKLSYPFIRSITQNLSQEIGRGGFGVVYLGDLGTGKVAVKKLSITQGFSEALFLEEVNCLLKAKHINIVRFLGYCAETHGEYVPFDGKLVLSELPQRLLCFEYAPKGNLHKYLEDKSYKDQWKVKYQMIRGICHGLNYLHGQRIIHLDLKPDNILLDARMNPKITDFGISRCFAEGITRIYTENVRGTRGSIAPETIDSGEITFKSDIYALGNIIIHILTGRNKYDFQNWHTSIDVDGPQVKSCIDIAKKCVAFDQNERPTIGEIMQKLDEIERL